MIRYVSGDILLSKAAAIAHGVAPGDHFSQGLALALRDRWPSMAKDFRHWCHDRNPKPGEAWIWGGAGGVRIINLLTQPAADSSHGHNPGKAHLEHVNHALKALCHLIEKEQLTSVALPRLATGVGALDWTDVQPLIEQRLGELGIPVLVYSEFHSGVEAEEGLDAVGV